MRSFVNDTEAEAKELQLKILIWMLNNGQHMLKWCDVVSQDINGQTKWLTSAEATEPRYTILMSCVTQEEIDSIIDI